MQNKSNFKTNIDELARETTRYMVSRIIENKQDGLLDMEVPSDFRPQLIEHNVEINLYSLYDNSLIFSDVIRGSDVMSVETLQYEDKSVRNFLFINFSKLSANINFPIGRYLLTLNFLEDTIGSSDNKILKLTKISPSRTEVELKLTDTSKLAMMRDFAVPLVEARYAEPILMQIFNQSGSDAINIPTSPVKIDSSSIYEGFSSGSGEKLVQYGFDDDDGDKPGINTITQNILNIAYPLARNNVREKILKSGSNTTFSEEELFTYTLNAIDIAYDSILQDEATNPSKYRFDLI